MTKKNTLPDFEHTPPPPRKRQPASLTPDEIMLQIDKHDLKTVLNIRDDINRLIGAREMELRNQAQDLAEQLKLINGEG